MFQPQITFTIEINRNLERIDRIRELINLVPIIPYWEAEIQRTALVNTVHYSTKIEGNTLNLEDVKKLLSGRKVRGTDKDKQEVANLQRVMEFVNDVAMNRDTILSENLIKQFNSYILRDIPGLQNIGEYRTGQNYIQNNVTGEIIFTPPIAWDVPGLMHDFVAWFSSGRLGLSPILQAGIGHLELVAIHPFWDGNGRTARALSTFIMYRGGYQLRRLFSWEECVGSNTELYHQAIRASLGERYGQQYNATPWLEYFTGAIAESLEKLRDHVVKLKQHMEEGYALGASLGLKHYQMQALFYIGFMGGVTTHTYVESTGVSRATAVRHLKQLLDLGLLQRVGKGRGAKYVFSDTVQKKFEAKMVAKKKEK
jgi:Fic family protein